MRAELGSALASRRSTGGDRFRPLWTVTRRRAALRGEGLDLVRQRAPRSRLIVARRAEPRRRPGAVRARHGAQAPHQTTGSRPKPSTGLAGVICGPEAASPAPTQLALLRRRFVDPLHLKTPHEAPLNERGDRENRK